MKRLIAAMSFAVFAHSAFADATYGPAETSNTERALPDVSQTGPAQVEQASPQVSGGEETESAATGDSTPSDGESAGSETDSDSSAEIDQ